MLSFHKVYQNKRTKFLSNNELTSLHRGRPRPRRSRNRPVPEETGSEEFEETGGEERETESDTGPRHVIVPQETRA